MAEKTNVLIQGKLKHGVIISRFPYIAESILKELDDKCFVNCRKVSKSWRHFIDTKKHKCIRRILKYAENMADFQNEWKKVLYQAPVKIVKKLALALDQFSQPVYPFEKRGNQYWLNGRNMGFLTNEWSPFSIAANSGCSEIYNYISEKVKWANPSDGTIPLTYAALNGHFKICKLIIANLSEKNPSNSNGVTALHWAAKNGHLKVCQLLIENVQEKNPQCNQGFTPFHEAATGGRFKSMLRQIRPQDQLEDFTKSNHFEICKLFIANIADKNPSTPNRFGLTPLGVAALCGQLEICKLILYYLDDKNPQMNNGDTPLHVAARMGHFEVCKLFIDNTENINPSDALGWTPLRGAVQDGDFQICKLLMDNMQGVLNKEILIKTAIDAGRLDMCKFLLDKEEVKKWKCGPVSPSLFYTVLVYLLFPGDFVKSIGCRFLHNWPFHYSFVCLIFFFIYSIPGPALIYILFNPLGPFVNLPVLCLVLYVLLIIVVIYFPQHGLLWFCQSKLGSYIKQWINL